MELAITLLSSDNMEVASRPFYVEHGSSHFLEEKKSEQCLNRWALCITLKKIHGA